MKLMFDISHNCVLCLVLESFGTQLSFYVIIDPFSAKFVLQSSNSSFEQLIYILRLHAAAAAQMRSIARRSIE